MKHDPFQQVAIDTLKSLKPSFEFGPKGSTAFPPFGGNDEVQRIEVKMVKYGMIPFDQTKVLSPASCQDMLRSGVRRLSWCNSLSKVGTHRSSS